MGAARVWFRRILILALPVFLFVGPAPCLGGWQEDTGYDWLEAEHGAGLPNGAGVRVAQVEAPVLVDHDGDPETEKVSAWMPNTAIVEFSGKTISDESGAGTGAVSGHATTVGRYFYGNSSSAAPGVTEIESFEASHWMGLGFLRNYTGFPEPLYGTCRVTSQAYVGTLTNSNALRRLDFVVDTDDAVQVVAPANTTSGRPLWSDAFNAVSVGLTSGVHLSGTSDLGSDYCPGRAKPDLVSPVTSTSMALATVAGCAALLVQTGHDNPALSTDPVETSTINRAGQTIRNAERSEVIKAVLLAGAYRETSNSGEDNISDYRADPENRAANNLDTRFGAGQVNIRDSFHILAGGEQSSAEDDPGNGGAVSWTGFDYDPAFGGSAGSNTYASYSFTTDWTHSRLRACLAWNLAIEGNAPMAFSGDADPVDLNLFLHDVTDPEAPVLVAASQSLVDNTENLFLILEPGRDYRLRVVPAEGSGAFSRDFAVAWILDQDPEKVPGPFFFLLIPALALAVYGIRKTTRFHG